MKLRVTGVVQGVGFRPFVYRIATEHNLHGYVLNRGDAGVELLLEGPEENVNDFFCDLKSKTPPLAQIYEVTTSNLKGKNEYDTFTIQESSNRIEESGSITPPDIAICNDCLKELRDPENPRYGYFFITCTNCGPRFTIIENLPYDRQNTTMKDFPMCGFCLREYEDPSNRRFHAQTVACPGCGPHAYLTDAKGVLMNVEDPIRQAGRLLSRGHIVAIKGYGGFHIAASTTNDKPLLRLREAKHRSQKPFAIMARSLEAIRTFAEVDQKQTDLLTSSARPIVLVSKSGGYGLSSLIAPELHNVGVMLPYSAMHYMLFDAVKDVAFVMTSANPPNQPIVNDNQEALDTLGDTVDYFLFHDRRIAHRCDDSVIRTHGENVVFLRRSRGYAPAPLLLKEKADTCVLALGGELNNTACVLNGERAFMTQHIGDVENLETRNFLEKAIKHIIGLTNTKIQTVACDLHPKFTTTGLAKQLAEENSWQLVQVQHHYAHIAGLMAEHNLDKIVGICCDGYGYGLNGEAWGGEILLCKRGTQTFKRVSHLQEQPLVGGDLATRYPLRIAAGMLHDRLDITDWLLQNAKHFPHGKREINVILEQLGHGQNLIRTTSCGRVLDAVAAVLNICFERTYEGEPSMKLESRATGGTDVLKLKPTLDRDVLDTTTLLKEIFDNRNRFRPQDLAYSAHVYIAEGLASLALAQAEKNNVENIGFSGGVACNEIVASIMRKAVNEGEKQFLVYKAVPPGDGGLSFGQAVVGGFSSSRP